MIIKRTAAALTAVMLSCGMVASMGASADTASTSTTELTEAQKIVADMGYGINLGNTFEAYSSKITSDDSSTYGTAWGSPSITQEMIQGIADEGIKTLRIPVAWSTMIDEDTYEIDERLLKRIDEVVGWAIDADMYVIINIHWDGGWMNGADDGSTGDDIYNDDSFATDYDKEMERFTKMWDQIGNYFINYDNHLIFEGANEELCWDGIWNHWGGSDDDNKKTVYDLCNKINASFVSQIRAQGGNNANRLLMIAGYGTDTDCTVDDMFEVPDDDMLAVSIHYYTPSTFTIDYGSGAKEWGTAEEYAQLYEDLDKIYERFTSQGIPVIMGEYGASSAKTSNGTIEYWKDADSVRAFNVDAAEAMMERGIAPVLWDIWYGESDDIAHYNRKTNKLNDTEFKTAIANMTTGIKEEADITVSVDGEAVDEETGITATYKDDDFKLEVSGNTSSLKYSSSNEDVVTVDSDGTVHVVASGSATITVVAEGTDSVMSDALEIPVTVEKLDNPPVIPTLYEDNTVMYVSEDITTTKDIELPEGWSFLKTYQLTEDETEVKLVYEDENYKNRYLTITIRKGEAPSTESDSSSDSTASSVSSSSSTSSTSSASSVTSSASSSSAAAATDNPATGAGAGLAGAVIVLAGAAVVVSRKRK